MSYLLSSLTTELVAERPTLMWCHESGHTELFCGERSRTRGVPREYGHVTTGLVVERLTLVEYHENMETWIRFCDGTSCTRGVPRESRQVKHLLLPIVNRGATRPENGHFGRSCRRSPTNEHCALAKTNVHLGPLEPCHSSPWFSFDFLPEGVLLFVLCLTTYIFRKTLLLPFFPLPGPPSSPSVFNCQGMR